MDALAGGLGLAAVLLLSSCSQQPGSAQPSSGQPAAAPKPTAAQKLAGTWSLVEMDTYKPGGKKPQSVQVWMVRPTLTIKPDGAWSTQGIGVLPEGGQVIDHGDQVELQSDSQASGETSVRGLWKFELLESGSVLKLSSDTAILAAKKSSPR